MPSLDRFPPPDGCPTLSLLDIVGLLYDAASEPARWRGFLEAGAQYFGAFSANFVHFDEAQPERSVAFLTGYGELPIEQRGRAIRKLTDLRDQDPRLSYSIDHPSKPFHCRQVLTAETLHASQSYREVLEPHGVEYTLMVSLSDTPDAFTALGFLRSRNEPPFKQSEVDDLGQLLPHLRRAISIQNQLAGVNQRLRASYQALESLPTGIIITRPNGSVEFANAAAREILGLCDGIEIDAAGVLFLPKQRHLAQLLDALLRVGETGIHDAHSIGRPSGRPAFHCVMSRLSESASDTLPNLFAEARVVLYLSDPEQALETSDELLQRIFGLTRAEARLVNRLVAGNSLSMSANEIGIQISTARSQLKAVFSKTGSTGQADLIRAVLSSPVWLARGKSAGMANTMLLSHQKSRHPHLRDRQ